MCSASKSSLILKNCTLITMCDTIPTASACIIEDTKILWVGDEADLPAIDAEVVDLQGAYVYPGFIDTHAHIFYEGHTKMHQLTLSSQQTKEEIISLVAATVAMREPGEWIVGFGWEEHAWEDQRFPTLHDLDSISPNNPVFLRRVDAHAAWVNSAALKVGSITRDTIDPEGGKIYRDSQGDPTGILLDNALKRLYACIPKSTDVPGIIKSVLTKCLTKGITSIHDARLDKEQVEACLLLNSHNDLPIRVYGMVGIPSDIGQEFLQKGPQHYGPFFEVRCIKLFVDGAMGSRGASLFEPYDDSPDESGLLLWSEKEFQALLEVIKDRGFQVACHAIGDKANHMVLNGYEKVKLLRPRIEHAQLLVQSDIARFKEIGVIAAMQPLHLPADMPWLDKRLGQKRATAGAYVWKSLLDAGCKIVGGSDAPIVDINPLLGMYAAVTRQDLSGNPSTGWNPEQRL
ncbi:MAG: amidohydrolase, partial [Chlamydiales bacterium]|nr:amidohydrolase [Chlamydiales bacterium]